MRKTRYLLALCFVLIFSQLAFGAEAPDKTIKGDYFKQYCQTLLEENKLTCDSDAVSMVPDSQTGKLVISGSKADITASKFTVDKEYDFDKEPVGRFSVDATSARGQKVVLGFYLDDEETPFAQCTLFRQRKKDVWTYQKNITIDVSELGIKGKHSVSFRVLDADSDKVAFAMDSFEFCRNTVPVVYFNIDESLGAIVEMNNSEDHSAECYGDVTIQVPDSFEPEYADKSKVSSKTYKLDYVRGRGNSTWMASRKPYKIKLDKSEDVLGMGKNKHWVLLANYYDNSMLRNKITYWLGEELGMAYTPKSEPVEVVMNGEYYGTYFLCEQIRVGKTRVNIDDLENSKEATEEPEISGGYLLSLGYEEEGDSKKYFTTTRGNGFLIESPEFEGYENKAQVDYISGYVQKLEDALYGNDFKSEDGTSFTEYLDLDSTSKYYWMQEFSMNGDAYASGSTYLYKPRNDKLYWGPLWDFDYVAWGSTEYDGLETSGWSQNSTSWNERLLMNPEFTETLAGDWNELDSKLTELTEKGGQLDKYAARIKPAVEYSFESFGPTDFYSYIFDEEETEKHTALTFDQEVERLREWITKRQKWVGSHVKSLKPVETTVTYKNSSGKVVGSFTEYVGRPLNSIPEGPARKGYIFLGWQYSRIITFEEMLSEQGLTEDEFRQSLKDEEFTDKEIDEYINYLKTEGIEDSEFVKTAGTARKDMVLTAVYVKESEVVYANGVYTLLDEYHDYYYSGAGFVQTTDITYELDPEYTTFDEVAFESDNEDVIKVEDGILVMKGAGTAKITIRAKGGAHKTVKVVVHDVRDVDSDDIEYIEGGTLRANRISLRTGQSRQLRLDYDTEGILYDEPSFLSTDTSVVQVGPTGVVRAVGQGEAVIVCSMGSDISVCSVKVTGRIKTGDRVSINGLTYKVTSVKGTGGTAACLGAYSKGKHLRTVRSAAIPATVKIRGNVLNVTAISTKAFEKCSRLKHVTIGSKVTSIGEGAFYKCRRLKTVSFRSVKVPKIGKHAFRGVRRSARYYVPKNSLKSYRKVFGKSRVRKAS